MLDYRLECTKSITAKDLAYGYFFHDTFSFMALRAKLLNNHFVFVYIASWVLTLTCAFSASGLKSSGYLEYKISFFYLFPNK